MAKRWSQVNRVEAVLTLGQVRKPTQAPLSQRELEVSEPIARGTTNRARGGEATLHQRYDGQDAPAAVYAKLGVNDRTVAVAAAFSGGHLAPRD